MGRRYDPIALEQAILSIAIERGRTNTPSFHAYGLARELQEVGRAQDLIDNGTLYKALRRMESKGWLQSEYEDPEIAARDRRPRRVLYQITSQGRDALAFAPRLVMAIHKDPAKTSRTRALRGQPQGA